jgi:hypothetical protein
VSGITVWGAEFAAGFAAIELPHTPQKFAPVGVGAAHFGQKAIELYSYKDLAIRVLSNLGATSHFEDVQIHFRDI